MKLKVVRYGKAGYEKWRLLWVLVLLFPISLSHIAQGQNKDSLLNALSVQRNDSNRVNTLNELAFLMRYMNPDSTIILCGQSAALAGKINFKRGESAAYSTCGIANSIKGQYPRALEFYFKALKIDEELGIKKRIMRHLGNIGLAYMFQGIYTRALDHYLKALRLAEEAGDRRAVAIILGNIGSVYIEQADYDKALSFFFRALEMKKMDGNKREIAITYGNIGNVYIDRGDLSKAMEYHRSAWKIKEELGDKGSLTINIGSIANMYKMQGDFDKAFDYYRQALKIDEEVGNMNGMSITLTNIGWLNLKYGRFAEAENTLKRALKLAEDNQDIEGSRTVYLFLSQLYDTTGNHRSALEHYKKYIAVRDSIINTETTRNQTRLEMQYEFDKRTVADSIKNAESRKLEELKHAQEISTQRNYTYAGIAGFLVMIAVAGISFNAFRNKKKANLEIARQKAMVEEKQKEILDSIYYARRIQRALITSEKYIERQLAKLQGA